MRTVKMAAAFLTAMLLLGQIGFAGQPIVMKLAGTTPANPELGEYLGMVKFAELVKEYTNGEVVCEVYPANQLGSTSEFIEGTSLGTIEACVAGTDTVAMVDPMQNVFSMPYLFKDLEHQIALMATDNPMKKAVFDSLEEKANLIDIGVLYRGFRVMANSKRPLRTPDDFKGLIMRSPEAAANVALFEALGAVPVTITWSEVFTSLAQKVADGAESAVTELYAINLQEVVSFLSETNHLSGIILIAVNGDWFKGLTPAQQAGIRKAGREATDYRLTLLKEEQKKAFAGFEAKGVQVVYSKDIDNAAFREVTKDVYKRFLDKFPESLYLQIRDMQY